MAGQARVQINLEAVAHNFALLDQLAPGRRVMAIVKADAYGQGAAAVAQALPAADAFGVARVSEAVKLREAGINQPICLLEGVADKEELNLASIYELDLVVHDFYQLALLKATSARQRLWLKFDTGMGRLGFHPDDVDQMADDLGSQEVIGLMTHLANADNPRDKRNASQLALLERIKAECPRAWQQAPVSAANSAAILGLRRSHYDWVRPGLMLYGASPMAKLTPDPRLLPAMTFSAPVIAVRSLRARDQVGYGGLWQAQAGTRVAVIAAGYGDGYPREVAANTPVLIAGQRRPLVGRVSMDMMCVELLPDDQVQPGDRATLWGEGLPIEEIAKAASTIPYTLMCGITPRVSRAYRGGRPADDPSRRAP